MYIQAGTTYAFTVSDTDPAAHYTATVTVFGQAVPASDIKIISAGPTGFEVGVAESYLAGVLTDSACHSFEVQIFYLDPVDQMITFSPLAYGIGDVNHDGVVNGLDIDAIYASFGIQSETLYYKVAPDGVVTYGSDFYLEISTVPHSVGQDTVGQEDVSYLLDDVLHCRYGDANLDGKVDFLDFQILLDNWQHSGIHIGWAQGDFNGYTIDDYGFMVGEVDFLDFLILIDYWKPG